MDLKNEYIVESERLKFRKIVDMDFNKIHKILKDEEIMYAWGHGFSEDETREWIEKNKIRYKNEGFSYFSVIQKNTGDFIGVMGPLIEEIGGEKNVGVAYIIDKKYWGNGYATEAVKVFIDYAFNILKVNKVIAQIRPENIKSSKVAQRVGMKLEGEFIKIYKEEEMLHYIYSISSENIKL
ncbi:MAG: GNAT family N-acetyltransferase [Cetobacterium sp.]|uniref:GNAT family N-acetyltransferase n=1 Tax=unclassified Cetobacterium TaxID=2630983 RepID=UPI0006477A4B|nr:MULTISPECIES: GNAT family N-acetyltransferase [unclassified Cetobacterium]